MGYRMFEKSKDKEKIDWGIKLPQVSRTFLPYGATKK
jgi:hypothetical protein